METFRFRSELDHPVGEVFRWHLEPDAFHRLLPPWEDVQVLERTGGPHEKGEVILRLRRGPLSFRWKVRHTAFEENRLFRDEQVSGPFRRWVHEHRFEELPSGGSAVEDVVEWEVPLNSRLASGQVRKELQRLFAFRHRRLRRDLDRIRGLAGRKLGRIAITGSRGFIGSHLAPVLRMAGARVIPVIRGEGGSGREGVRWDPSGGRMDPAGLEGVDAVVHLAGESIAAVRWTESKKREILESRERGTRLLARSMAQLDRPPATLVSASGVNYYGDRGAELLTEESPPGEGFLARVCRSWEKATEEAEDAGVRTAHFRSGMVLSPAGGALGTMLLPFRLGVGGRLGSGRQYVPWIDLDDHVALILHALSHSSVEGPVNAVGPGPVPNATFTSTLGRVLGRPTLIPVPALGVRALLGEMGEELLLSGQRAVPRKAESSGFDFFSEDLETALRHQLGRAPS